MTPGAELLHLSYKDVASCGLAQLEIIAAVESAFLEKARGKAGTKPGVVVPHEGGTFHAKVGVTERYAAVKWFGYFPSNAGKGRPDFWPTILLSECETGLPVAIMDGRWISQTRTAAISAIAAKHLARPGADRLGFVACGAQARAHFEALRACFDIRSVRAYSRRPETAEAFAAMVRDSGCEARAIRNPREALSDADIVVTSVPRQPAGSGFLEVGWTPPGAFMSMVDLGGSWKRENLSALDLAVTDVIEQGSGAPGFNFAGTFDADLPGIVSGSARVERRRDDRVGLIFAGTGLADVAVARIVFERALERGLGASLPL